MPDRLFPRWCGALFALLPLSEILYLPADAQSLYAAAAACAAAGLLAAGAARLSSAVAARPGVQLLLALAALFPLVCSLSRMSSFLRATVFTRVPLWVLCLALTLCALAHALSGLNVCAMWALPAVFLAGAVAVLSGVLTAGELRLSRLAAPTAALLPQFWSLLRLLLPGTLILRSRCATAVLPGRPRADSRQAVRCLRCCRSARCCCSALTPPPCFPIRTSLLPGLPRSGILHATARCFSRCRSFCARPDAAPRS